ncbi:hypothetical protein CTAYLR_008916 [Chrysophaeum taylorii]|uniref:FAD/NAD(P)-binding domain-containing protein n=1 Tax=Chrysophaeum taylorii TaxID=2483200 RepID=A0AAD7UC02_9STRA|nr:hypothetical protein CTAYLR_008916 [Chrysophaeum taylorii]
MGQLFSKKSLEDAPVVAIVGGGYAGAKIAKALDASMNVVLIDRKDWFLHNVATPRAFVHPEFTELCAIPYDKLLKNGHVVQATVTGVQMAGKPEVSLSDGTKVKVDYAVIATGTAYAFPFKVPFPKREGVRKMYEEVAAELMAASDVVVVGGGSTGLEAASEIAEEYEDCAVTVVHAGPQVMMPGPWKQKFVDKLTEQLGRYPNLKVVLNDRVLETPDSYKKFQVPEKKKVSTKNGLEIKCDIMFWCVGGRVNSACYEQSFETDASGQIVVDEYLRVTDAVFAAGDCAKAGTMKTVNFANQHADCVAKNIKLSVKGKPLQKFKPGPNLNVTQLGKEYGAGDLPIFGGMVVGAGFVQMIKKDMFSKKFWQDMGYPKLPAKFDQFNDQAADSDEKKKKKKTQLEQLLQLDPDAAETLAQGIAKDQPFAEYT